MLWLLLVTTPPKKAHERGKVTLRTTSDVGNTWFADIPLNVSYDRIQPLDSTTGWARHNSDFFVTSDGGRSWTRWSTLLLGADDGLLASHQLTTSTIVISKKGRVFESSAGPVWNELPRIPLLVNSTLYSVQFAGDDVIYALSIFNELFSTGNPRHGWNEITTLTGGTKGFLAWQHRLLIRSTEGPIKSFEPGWSDQRIALDLPSGDPFGVALTDSGHAAMVTSSGEILSSADNGRTWSVLIHDPSSLAGPLALAEDGWGVAQTGDKTIWTTSDGGVKWHRRSETLDGTLTKIVLANGRRGLAEVRHGDPWEADNRLYAIADDSWQEVPDQPDLSLFRFITADLLAGINVDGTLRESRDGGRTWIILSTDIRQWLASQDLEPDFYDMFWLDAQTGWICGSKGIVFRTIDGGRSWRHLAEPEFEDADFIAVFFLDVDNGFLYDRYRDDMFETSDGGDVWRRLDTPQWESNLQYTAFTHSGLGILASKEGVNYVRNVAVGTALQASVIPTGLRSLRLKLEAQHYPLNRAKFKQINVLVRPDRELQWSAVTSRPQNTKQDLNDILIDWDPMEQDIRIDAGERLGEEIELSEGDNLVTSIRLPEIYYLPWLYRHPTVFNTLKVLIVVISAMLCISGVLYLFWPRVLLSVVCVYESILEVIKELKIIAFLSPLIKLLFDFWLGRLARSERVVKSWSAAYERDSVGFKDLSDDTFRDFAGSPLILDAWVQKHLEQTRAYFNNVLFSLEAGQYVKLPVELTCGSVSHTTEIIEPTARGVGDLIGRESIALGVVAKGGTGKTTLVGQIGLWVMEAEVNRRLLAENAALAVMIRTNTTNILADVVVELKKAFQSSDEKAYDPTLIREAARLRRLVLILDGLSEWDDKSLELTRHLFASLPFSLLVFTSRRSFPDISNGYVEISPKELARSDLNRFVAEYIFLNRARESFSPRQELALSERLIEMIERRSLKSSLPVLFVKLLLDSYDPRRDSGVEAVPVSLAETVQRFVRRTRTALDGEIYDPELLVEAAATLARLSLARAFSPRVIDGGEARRELSKRFEAIGVGLMRALMEGNVIIDYVTAAGSTIKFRLDPVAEYLSAISCIKEFSSDEVVWRRHLVALEASIRVKSEGYGYLEALLECVSSLESLYNLPSFVSRRLFQLVPADRGTRSAA